VRAGGGDDRIQLERIRELLAFTETSGTAPGPAEIASALYDTSTDTFNRGQIGAWRDEMSSMVRRAFREESSELLQMWGYQE